MGTSIFWVALLFGLGLDCLGNWGRGVATDDERGGSCNCCVLVVQEGLDLNSFPSNSKAKNMFEMEDTEKVEKETIGSMVKEIELEEEWNTAMEIVEHYIHHSID